MQTQKRYQWVSEIPFQNPFEAGNQLDAGVHSQSHQVIMPSWLPKVPSWLRKNALCLSQSAFSNSAPYVIKFENNWERKFLSLCSMTSLRVLNFADFADWPRSEKKYITRRKKDPQNKTPQKLTPFSQLKTCITWPKQEHQRDFALEKTWT